MLKNFQKPSSLLLLASFLLALTMATPAEADRRRSKIRGPGDTWTWGPDIPHTHPRNPQDIFHDGVIHPSQSSGDEKISPKSNTQIPIPVLMYLIN